MTSRDPRGQICDPVIFMLCMMTEIMNRELNAKRAEQWDRYLVP